MFCCSYAVRQSAFCIKVFKNFKETLSIKTEAAEGSHPFVPASSAGWAECGVFCELMARFPSAALFGGPLIGVRESESVAFFDWQTGALVRRIEVLATNVYWSQSKSSFCIARSVEKKNG